MSDSKRGLERRSVLAGLGGFGMLAGTSLGATATPAAPSAASVYKAVDAAIAKAGLRWAFSARVN